MIAALRAHLTAMRPARCPLCRKPADPVLTPFCSQGCKDRDLLRWLGDGYRMPGPAASPGEDMPD